MNRDPRPKRPAPWLALLLAPVLLQAGACSTTPDEPEPSLAETQVVAGSDSLLWKVVLLSLRKLDYPEGAEMDRAQMKVISGWKIELSPWKGKGTRKQAEVVCKPIGPGRWALTARVKTQINNALARTLDYSYAEWEWVPDDQTEARIILQHVRAFLQPDIEVEDAPPDPLEHLKKTGGKQQ
jgi:hypothetical protein